MTKFDHDSDEDSTLFGAARTLNRDFPRGEPLRAWCRLLFA